jgi:hypothetical protein
MRRLRGAIRRLGGFGMFCFGPMSVWYFRTRIGLKGGREEGGRGKLTSILGFSGVVSSLNGATARWTVVENDSSSSSWSYIERSARVSFELSAQTDTLYILDYTRFTALLLTRRYSRQSISLVGPWRSHV